MEVCVPVSPAELGVQLAEIAEIYKSYYHGGMVAFTQSSDEDGFLSAAALSGRDDMEISVVGNDERAVLVSRFDNLGKGASGAAVQNMNLLMGIDEKTGLNTGLK